MGVHRIFGSLAILAFLGSPAWAEDCGPLKQIASLDMTVGTAGRYLVPVTINDTPQKMLLATGGGVTNLRQDAVTAMGLHPIDASHIKLLSGNGTVSQDYVQVDFRMGVIHDPILQTIVMPIQGNGPPPFAGELAGDFLSLYDVEMDFAGRKLNFFSKDHCPGHVLYWNPTAVAVVPISLQMPTAVDSRTGFRRYAYRGSHINVPVTINDKPFKAALNTASLTSTMSEDTAKFIFGVTADSPGAVPLGSVDGNPDHKAFSYVFPTLTFDTVTVTNAKFYIYPNLVGSRDPNNTSRTDTRVSRIDDNIGGDISIGLDVLRKLHLYVAYGELKLYVTPATTAPAQSAPSPQAAK
jgi:hypothetical protein